jgi:hypothetical protein
MKEYVYKGNTETYLAGYGIVKPGDTIKYDKIINNDLFELKVKENKKYGKSSK